MRRHRTPCDVRGGIPPIPLSSDITLGPRVLVRVQEYKRVRGSALFSRMDPKQCLWCSDMFFGYRHYTHCCQRLYHWDCLVRHAFVFHPAKRLCPHCGAINFGEPFKVSPRFKQYLKEHEKRGKCFNGLVVQTSRCGHKDPGLTPGRGIDRFFIFSDG